MSRRHSYPLLALPFLIVVVAAGYLALQHHSLAAQLWLWLPLMLQGFSLNILISFTALLTGTLLGLLVGALCLSGQRWLAMPLTLLVRFFRNSPWLVLVYFSMFALPFEVQLGGHQWLVPDWLKAALGLTLPAAANIAEVFRGAVQSIPAAQWEAASMLALRRTQVLRLIILPQCLRRMLPPWMNLYAMITMGTALASLVGVKEVLSITQSASSSVHDLGFTLLGYVTVFALFFFYCYPISLLTRRLERRYAFH